MKFDISIVIVNYNVKDLLFNCLKSIQDASKKLNVQTIVVDNNSIDKSVEYLTPLFPDVEFIANKENVGFSKANNQGFEISTGKYVLILNPDTVLNEETLNVMYDYMEKHPETGMSGCKVLNPDGSFQLSCRRGFPTPWNSFSKLFGLQSLFPKVKLFSGYNLTFKSIDDTYEVDALIGAFMFARKNVLDEIGGFDEQFFMYGEDLDLCYKVKEAGWKIDYVHTTTIIHYKGESTRRSSIKEVKHFYESMEIYAKKHFSFSAIFLLLLRAGIIFRSLLSYLKKYRTDLLFLILDIFLITYSYYLSNFIKYRNIIGFPPEHSLLFLGIIISILIVISISLGQYFESRPSIRKTFYAGVYTLVLVGFSTYLIRGFDLSRTVLMLSTINFIFWSSTFRVIYLRDIQKNIYRKFLVIGDKEKGKEIKDYLNSIESKNVMVSDREIENADLLKIHEEDILNENFTDLVLIKNGNEKDIHKIQGINNIKVNNLQDFIGKRLLTSTLGAELGLNESPLNNSRILFFKRIGDIFSSLFLLTLGIPFIYLLSENPKRFISKSFKMLIGQITLVGSYNESDINNLKVGLTGLAHISGSGKLNKNEIEQLEKFYAKNISLSLDIEIIIKTLTKSNQA